MASAYRYLITRSIQFEFKDLEFNPAIFFETRRHYYYVRAADLTAVKSVLGEMTDHPNRRKRASSRSTTRAASSSAILTMIESLPNRFVHA